MFVEERQEKILELLDENEKVKVKELSQQFKVTEDCIRKDLAAMEGKGLLKRAYGGAVKIKLKTHESRVEKRRDKNIKEKHGIAKKAVKLIHTGDVVFLDISTTNIEVAKEIIRKELKVTVVTNMLDIANVFAKVSECAAEFILIGGTFNRKQDGFLGGMPLNLISKFRFDISFIGVVGADLDNNTITTYAMEDGILKEEEIKASKKCYLVMEKMKFDLDANYVFASFDKMTGVVCEGPLEKEKVNKLKQYQVEVY
ncbi:MAG: DeoR/GlpR family DNA-binding transcription regulator [Anaerostipes sp.]|jgi:DeoR/GlpR family transcriptional regulator of sugar metabolism